MKNNKICTFVTSSGKRCGAFCLLSRDFCYFHDPSKKEDARKSSSNGGKSNKRLKYQLDDFKKIKNALDVKEVLEKAVNDVSSGRITLRTANTIGYLSKIMLVAIKNGDEELKTQALQDFARDLGGF